ncbi:spore germination cell wall hydrolase CwlJ-like protein [Sedimentibacter acidaminivorans]|uniref:Spore germination cell wall hydrolase CwlJ-like protein n=1 Tax=Sedimentibacter acidaminivorans TaxID=913099 RepID=A0ABS4G9P2_9FIRM|nr:cell wall hydrolase [Sedimentibacter acidaminivorans]MBP1924410.1 spore germination cell wall hydrolase CwlJ-like protein [Sedimentibacter acidaminivorans]
MKFKGLKSILLTTGLTLGISLSFSSNAYAATYTAVSGDSLYKISQLFNTTVASLVVNNNLLSTSINIGQVLDVTNLNYTVKKGDTLYLIAKQHNVSLDELRRANNIYTNYIDIGQNLSIPIKSTSIPSDTVNTNLDATYSSEDLDLLARLITAEAQGESYDAKIAVGAVVMNRVKSDSFPNSINDVIYQVINGYYQFTPVLNGWINKPAQDECIKAAKEVLNGTDPTNGALFFFESSITNTWLLSRPVSMTVDNMTFSY